MRSWLYIILIVSGFGALIGCGGKKSTTPNTTGAGVPTTVVVSPTNASLNRGATVGFSGAVQDGTGATLANQTITFKSSNTAVVTIASSGLACAGTWDSLTIPVVCTPGPTGTAQITASSGSLNSTPVNVFVHERVDNVVVSPSTPNCASQSQTLQFTAKVFGNNQDLTSLVGPPSWTSSQPTVATIDTNGLATGVLPGLTTIFASVAGVNSLPVSFQTCPVEKITFHVADSNATSATLDALATQQFAIEATDTRGVVVNNLPLQFNYTQPVVAQVGLGALITAAAPGATSITASCTPPQCNVGITSVYSNPVTVKVNGTGNATTVYAASTAGTSLTPIDTSTNSAGTVVTLPQKPNSIAINQQGTRAFLGGDTGL